jgi:hypothetical protein
MEQNGETIFDRLIGPGMLFLSNNNALMRESFLDTIDMTDDLWREGLCAEK